MRRPFATLDVFTDRRFAGNPLAVVLDADELDAAAMQAIAREFNHPETVFVFAPAELAHRARVRIFTPARELPFAGHPTVGTAVPLASLSAMARCRPDLAKFDAAFGAGGAAYAFCNETAEPGHHFHARMFAPGMGIAEDPATGSAAAAFAGLLASRLPDGSHAITIEQGYEMGRPSLLRLAAEVSA